MSLGVANSTRFTEADLTRLYTRLERPVFNVVYRWVWNRQTADEIVQDTFVQIWNQRDRVRPETVEALVYRIAINASKNHRRWQRLRTFFSMATLQTLSNKDNQETDLMQHQDQQALRAAIDALPAKQKEVILLCHFSEMTYDMVGEIAGIPSGTVASRRNTALRTLRNRLGSTHG